jgi:diguanylate cyclase (GGDEF)-like protein
VEIEGSSPSQVLLQQRLDKLYNLAHHDPLTGLANRRFLESAVQTRIEEMRRYGWGFGFLFIDVDGFKSLNDFYGHEVGDLILITIGSTLLNCKRASDIVGRWGGDEFVVILPNLAPEDLPNVAERYRMLVAETHLHDTRVSVSVGGLAATPEDTLESIITHADLLMYASKMKGKNCVTIDRKEGEDAARNNVITQPTLFALL